LNPRPHDHEFNVLTVIPPSRVEFYSAGGGAGAETGEKFAAFDNTQETADSSGQIDRMADLTIADST